MDSKWAYLPSINLSAKSSQFNAALFGYYSTTIIESLWTGCLLRTATNVCSSCLVPRKPLVRQNLRGREETEFQFLRPIRGSRTSVTSTSQIVQPHMLLLSGAPKH